MPRTDTPEVAAEWLPIDSLTPWADNPRTNDHAVPEVARSIERFGFASPIIARRAGDTLEIIAGHTRHKAALSLGLDRVPVRVLDLDPTDARLLALADNRLGELADWSAPDLASVIEGLKGDGAALDGLGWTPAELDALTAPPAKPEDWGTLDFKPESRRAPTVSLHLSLDESCRIEEAIDAAMRDGAVTRGAAMAAICEAFCA